MTNRSNPAELRVQAAYWVGSIHILNSFAASNLVHCVQADEREVALAAAITLAARHFEPDLVIPALTNLIHDATPAIRSLAVEYIIDGYNGYYGNKAEMALPTFLELLSDPSIGVRISATNAVYRINPNLLPPGTKLPLRFIE